MRIGLLLLVIFLNACQTTAQAHERLVAAFDDATFSVAPDRLGQDRIQHNSRLSRWNNDIIYSINFEDGISGQNTNIIHKSMVKFNDILPINVIHDGASERAINLTIEIKQGEKFLINGNQQADCYAGFSANEDSQIEKAEVVISIKNLNGPNACLEHELMHAIGFSGHTHRIRSILSYFHGEKSLTKWDRFLIETLYSPKLNAGMERDETLIIVEELAMKQQ